VKVLVVGAGPAGVATALLLARYGVDVKLVERERSFARVFRGEGLMPLGIDALSEMGLGGEEDDRVDAGVGLRALFLGLSRLGHKAAPLSRDHESLGKHSERSLRPR
jgi:2-polyprenyl-6-methoxyphenol hydroxylase-like FAD-dependent oxidoreductase